MIVPDLKGGPLEIIWKQKARFFFKGFVDQMDGKSFFTKQKCTCDAKRKHNPIHVLNLIGNW